MQLKHLTNRLISYIIYILDIVSKICFIIKEGLKWQTVLHHMKEMLYFGLFITTTELPTFMLQLKQLHYKDLWQNILIILLEILEERKHSQQKKPKVSAFLLLLMFYNIIVD